MLFITEIPELILEDPSEAKENLILQETSVVESLATDGSPGLKSVLSKVSFAFDSVLKML